MVSALVFTVVGSYISSLVPPGAMGNFSLFMTFLLGVKSANRAGPKLPDRVTGMVLILLGLAVTGFNLFA